LWILHAGKYTLVPYYQGENTLFDVSPASVEIAVGHDFFKIPKPFEVFTDANSSATEASSFLSETIMFFYSIELKLF